MLQSPNINMFVSVAQKKRNHEFVCEPHGSANQVLHTRDPCDVTSRSPITAYFPRSLFDSPKKKGSQLSYLSHAWRQSESNILEYLTPPPPHPPLQ